jgi:hypothetical protein
MCERKLDFDATNLDTITNLFKGNHSVATAEWKLLILHFYFFGLAWFLASIVCLVILQPIQRCERKLDFDGRTLDAITYLV